MKHIILTIIIFSILISSCDKKEEQPNNIIAYGNIEATVINQSTGDLLYNAYVLLIPSGKATATGSDGRFVFSDIKAGIYNMQVFKENFIPTIRSIDVESNKTIQPNIHLVRSSGKLSINKAYLDFSFGNIQNFTISNTSTNILQWQVQSNCNWISIEPENGTISALSAQAINVNVDKNAANENYAILSVTASDGFASTILLTTGADGNGGSPTFMQIGNIAVQKQDVTNLLVNYESACYYCKHSRVGGYEDWRLPTENEGYMLFQNQNAIGGFKFNNNCFYWTSTYYNGTYYVFSAYNGHYVSSTAFSSNTHSVRCVRSLK